MSKIFCTAALVSAIAFSGAAFAQGTSTMPSGSSTMAPPAATDSSTMAKPMKATKPMPGRKTGMAKPSAESAEEQATAQLNLRQIGQ